MGIEEINQASLQFQRSVPVQYLQRTELSTYLQALVLVAIVGQTYAQGLGLQVESGCSSAMVGVTLQDVRSGLSDILARAKGRLCHDDDDEEEDGVVEQKEGEEGREPKRRRKDGGGGGGGLPDPPPLFFPSLPSLGELRVMCERMATMDLLVMSQPKGSGHVRVRLAIQPSDLAQSLRLRMQAEKRRVGKDKVEGVNEEEQWLEEFPPAWDFLPPNLKAQ